MLEINGVQFNVPGGNISITVDEELKVLTELEGTSLKVRITRDPSKVYNNASTPRSVPSPRGESSSGLSTRSAG